MYGISTLNLACVCVEREEVCLVVVSARGNLSSRDESHSTLPVINHSLSFSLSFSFSASSPPGKSKSTGGEREGIC